MPKIRIPETAPVGRRPVFEPMEPRLLLASGVIINEFLAINQSTSYTDYDGDRSDWIELRNTSASAVALTGWYLTDDAADPHKWQFPSKTLLAGRYLVVFASGKDAVMPNGEFHTNFKLSSGGEYLALIEADGYTVATEFAPQYPDQRADVSYSAAGYYLVPTPTTANGAVATGLVADTAFDHDRGFYDAAFDLVISSATPGAVIRYTTDGSLPTLTHGATYTGPISITTTTTVRAYAYKSGCVPTNVDTQTYLFLDDVIWSPASLDQLPPAGLPSLWGGYGADYDMDPEIAGTPGSPTEYTALMKDALKAIPTLSIVTDIDYLFGATNGIYTHTTTDMEWPTSVELIFPEGYEGDPEGFQIDAGIQIQGGANREPAKSPKHSLAILFKGDYGPGKLDYPFFGPSAANQFDRIVLRAGYNNSWIHSDASQRLRAQYIRDLWARDTLLALGQPGSHGDYVHLYLNGMYWGLYNPSERPDDHFAAEYFGGAPEDYDVVHCGNGTVLVGEQSTWTAWNTMMSIASGGLSSPSAYAAIQQYLDVGNLIDYMIVNLYAEMDDWPANNWYAIRRKETGAGFRFFVWDGERCLESVSEDRTGVNSSNTPAYLYSKLRQNAEFRMLFADHVHRFFFNDGPLTAAAVEARWMARADQIDLAVIGESARWGDYRRDVRGAGGPVYTRNVHWAAEQNNLLTNYFPYRSDKMIRIEAGVLKGQWRTADLYPSVIAPSFSQHGGQITAPFALTMTNQNAGGTIYYTLDGSDPRCCDPVTGAVTISPTALQYQGPVTLTTRTPVQARVLLGGVWSALNAAIFATGAISPLRITEIMYNPAGGGSREFIELRNVSGGALNVAGLQFTCGLEFTFPAMEVAAGAYVLVVRDQAAFQAAYPSVPVALIAGAFLNGTSLDNDGERLVLTDPVTGVVHDFSYKDGWYKHTDGQGFSLVLRDPLADLAAWGTKDAWRASWLAGGNPAEADPGYDPKTVVINEMCACGPGAEGDWIELKNTADEPVPIGGWYLSDDPLNLMKYRIPDGVTLSAGGYKVFTETGDFGGALPISAAAGGLYLTSSPAPGVLGGYREDEYFDGSEAGTVYGRYLKSTGGKDFTVLSEATPGGPNAYPAVGPIVLSEVMYAPQTGDEFIELYNLSADAVPLYDPAQPQNRWKLLEGVTFTFPEGASIPGHAYALVVGIDPAEFRSRYGIPAEVQIFGPYTGLLDNAGEMVVLARPAAPDGIVPYIRVDRLTYGCTTPWPTEPYGSGPSLERVVSGAYGNDVANWAVGPTGGTPGAQNATADFAPQIVAVEFNDRPGRTVSDIEPSGIGVRSLDIVFSEPVVFAPEDVTLRAVTFDGLTEVPGAVLPPLTVSGSGTTTMRIEFATASVLDTWVKVTLRGWAILDEGGIAMDGEPRLDSSGLGYIYKAADDLPSGNGVVGGDAVFYVGSLRGDMQGPTFSAADPDGRITVWDINGFTLRYLAGNLDADMWGGTFMASTPEGILTPWDINGFTIIYRAAVAAGRHLDPLPTGIGTLAVSGPAPLVLPQTLESASASVETALVPAAAAESGAQTPVAAEVDVLALAGVLGAAAPAPDGAAEAPSAPALPVGGEDSQVGPEGVATGVLAPSAEGVEPAQTLEAAVADTSDNLPDPVFGEDGLADLLSLPPLGVVL